MPGISDTLLRVALSAPYQFFWRALCWVRRPHIYIGDGVVLTRTVFGHYIYLDGADTNIAPSLLMRGLWEPSLTRTMIRTIQPGMRYVEVGANVGYYALLAGARVGGSGRSFVFEANPRLADLTRRTLRVNGMDSSTVHPLAVADQTGRTTFHLLPHQAGGGNLYSAEHPDAHPQDIHAAKQLEVPVTTLDDFFAQDPAPIDILRIDAEGAEPAILAGARHTLERSPRCRIFMELYPRLLRKFGQDPRAFLDSLRQQGYQVREIINGRAVALDFDEVVARESGLADLLIDRP